MTDHANEARTLADDTVVVDMLAPGAPFTYVYKTREGFESFVSHYVEAGVTWASFTAAMDTELSIELTMKYLARARRYFMDQPDRFVFIETADDVHRAKREGKLAVNFNFQGTNPLQGDLYMVEVYRRLGVGHMLMAYNEKNLVGDGCHERTDSGLSRWGIALVAEMNRVGMVVDITHTGYRTSMEVCDVSTAPVIHSHSNPKALFDHPRNVPDDQIEACARTGGVIGISGVGIFLSEAGDDVSADIILRSIDYAVQLVGPEHVGLGLDYVDDNDILVAIMMQNATRFPSEGGYAPGYYHFASPKVIADLADGMLQMGYSDAEVRGILGENWLRVVREVW